MRILSIISDKPHRTLLLSFASILLALAAGFSLPSGASASGGWRGWSALAVKDELPLEEVVRTLEAAGITPVCSELSQTVYLTDFVTAGRVPLRLALKRLLPEDPRRTVWLDRLTEYYRIDAGKVFWNILYVPEKYGSSAVRALNRLPCGTSWGFVAGNASRGLAPLWIPAAGLVAFLIIRTRRPWFIPAAAALPWIPLWVSGSLSSVLSGFFGYIALITVVSENDLQPGRIFRIFSWNSAARLAPPAAVFALAALSNLRSLPGSLLSALSAFVLLLVFENGYRKLDSRQVHAVFAGPPVDRIRSERGRDEALQYRTLAALAASFLALALFGLPVARIEALPSGGGEALLDFPVPAVGAGNRSVTAEQISELVRSRSPLQVPDLADAIAHRAYQEALPNSRIGSRSYGSLGPVIVESYRSNGSEVLESQTRMANFDDAWVREALREERREGIGAVLAGQKTLTRVEKRSSGGLPASGSLALKSVFFYIILLAPSGLVFVPRKRWKDPFVQSTARSTIER